MALTLAVGFVVDDAIVMLENIVRHMEKGEPVLEAALNGSREIGFTIISMTLSLVAVFIPVLLPGRAHRPAVPRVRGHDRRGDPGVGLRVAHPHADAVQPVAQAATRERSEHGRFYQAIERAWDRLARAGTSAAWAG